MTRFAIHPQAGLRDPSHRGGYTFTKRLCCLILLTLLLASSAFAQETSIAPSAALPSFSLWQRAPGSVDFDHVVQQWELTALLPAPSFRFGIVPGLGEIWKHDASDATLFLQLYLFATPEAAAVGGEIIGKTHIIPGLAPGTVSGQALGDRSWSDRLRTDPPPYAFRELIVQAGPRVLHLTLRDPTGTQASTLETLARNLVSSWK